MPTLNAPLVPNLNLLTRRERAGCQVAWAVPACATRLDDEDEEGLDEHSA
jgi:hypothetical protein